MAGVIPEESRTGTQIFRVGTFGDSDADDREVLGLPFLNQAADEHVGDLGKRRMSVEYRGIYTGWYPNTCEHQTNKTHILPNKAITMTRQNSLIPETESMRPVPSVEKYSGFGFGVVSKYKILGPSCPEHVFQSRL